MPRITYTDENTSPGGRHHISCPRMLEIKDPRVTGGSPGHWYGADTKPMEMLPQEPRMRKIRRCM